jgi:hypothetical protein
MCSRLAACLSVALLLLLPAAGVAGTAGAAETTAEQRTAQELEHVRLSPLELRHFLKRMPKGADLHNQLDGAVYAETFIRVGGEDGQVALATDDEGVSRIDLTQEYVRAVETFSLAYADLKEIVRNSLEYSFLPGPSLWGESGSYARVVEACRTDAPGADKPSQPCAAFLDGSEKAAQQWELERRFSGFEAGYY